MRHDIVFDMRHDTRAGRHRERGVRKRGESRREGKEKNK